MKQAFTFPPSFCAEAFIRISAILRIASHKIHSDETEPPQRSVQVHRQNENTIYAYYKKRLYIAAVGVINFVHRFCCAFGLFLRFFYLEAILKSQGSMFIHDTVDKIEYVKTLCVTCLVKWQFCCGWSGMKWGLPGTHTHTMAVL